MTFSSHAPVTPAQPYGYGWTSWKPIKDDVKAGEPIVLSDRFSIFWNYEYMQNPPVSNGWDSHYRQNHFTEVCLVVTAPDGSTKIFKGLDEYDFQRKHKNIWKEFVVVVEQYKAKEKRIEANIRAKERRVRLKSEAEQAGVPFKEYEAEIRRKNREKKVSGITKADVKETGKRIEFASYLNQLKREVDIAMVKLADEDSNSIDLKYMNRKIAMIELVVNMLLEANRGKASK